MCFWAPTIHTGSFWPYQDLVCVFWLLEVSGVGEFGGHASRVVKVVRIAKIAKMARFLNLGRVYDIVSVIADKYLSDVVRNVLVAGLWIPVGANGWWQNGRARPVLAVRSGSGGRS